MKHILRLIFLTIILYPSLSFGLNKDSLKTSNLVFSENKGQWPEQVKFRTDINGGNLWIEKNALNFSLLNPKDLILKKEHHSKTKTPYNKSKNNIRGHSYKIEFINSNNDTKIIGHNKLSHFNNYFLGNDKTKWASNIRNFSSISYENIYKNIDLNIYDLDNNLKWDFIVKPNTDPSIIKLNYQGVDKIRIKNNNLEITTSVNTIIELKPIAYQKDERGNTKEIACKYHLKGNLLSFKFPKGYDKSKDLIIDPTLVFATYSGSGADNWGFSATYDSKGFLYAGGVAFMAGYPTTPGAFQSTYASYVDVAITKYDTTGTFLIYSTYLGGEQSEAPASLIVNRNDELFVLGTTSSIGFPTTSQSYDTTFNGGTSMWTSSQISYTNGSDLFVTHFNTSGNQLIGSTYLGGSSNDGVNPRSYLVYNYSDDLRGEIACDIHNNIYIASSTLSGDFPIAGNTFQTTKDNFSDGVVVKMDNLLSTVIWSTFIGGNDSDAVYGIKVSKKQDVFITGGTQSTNLNTSTGAYQTNYQGGNTDGFVARISKDGKSLTNCSYIGSSKYDQSYLIDLDRYSNVYLFGQTLDTGNTFIYNALWNSPKDGQFIIKLNSKLDTRSWATTWGNGNPGIDVVPSAFMVDLCNRVYLSAWGGGTNANNHGKGNTYGLPISSSPIQSTTDGSDYYLMVMTDDASALDYGSYYGGSSSDEHVDGGTSRFDNKGRIYQNVCAGCGGHSDFPTTSGCWSSANPSGNCNNGVFKVDFNIPAIVADYDIPPVLCLPDTSFFNNTSFLSHPSLTQYSWDFDDGNTSSNKSPWHIYANSGIYNVKLIIYDPQSCNLRDTIIQQVVVLSGATSTLPTEYICEGGNIQIGILPIQDTSVHFNWSPLINLSDPNICNPYANPTSTTSYTMTATNGLCTDTMHQTVEVIQLVANAGNDTTICLSNITLTGNGNYNDLHYLWSSTNNFTDTLNNFPYTNTYNHTFTNPLYLYLEISKLGCSAYDSVFVGQRIITSASNIQPPKCNGENTGSISLNVIGGGTPHNYLWNSGHNTKDINNLTAGIYTLTITDSDGCLSYFDTILTEPEILISDTASINIPCEIACIGKAFANPQGGTSPYNWQWDDGMSQSTNPAIALCQGTYNVTVSDANNCITTNQVTILDSAANIIFDAWTQRDTIYEGEEVEIFATNLGSAYNYLWTPSDGLSDVTIPNPVANPNTTTTYIVETEDAFGCYWTDTVTIYVTDVVCDEPYIYVPNAFTPNNDGKNDYLKVESIVGYEMTFMIYDRWGELVFETTNIDDKWDGNYKGKKLNPGVYVYHLNFRCYNHQVFSKKGNITLIR